MYPLVDKNTIMLRFKEFYMRNIQKQFIKGFTLIELLVVISIIGMLSSIVLASLKNARDKASDAKIKTQLRSLRPAAELYRDSASGDYGKNYGPIVNASNSGGANTIGYGCAEGIFADPKIAPYLSLTSNPSYVVDDAHTRCLAISDSQYDARANKYLVILKLSNGKFYCVDSIGSIVEQDINYRNHLSSRQEALLVGGNGVIPLYGLVKTCVDLWC